MKHLLLILGVLTFLTGCNERTVRKQGFEVHGIDVSHYQKDINWQKVASQNIHFAFVKATEGMTHQDTLFCQNWDGMKANGLRRGAYHFFRPTVDPIAQAQNFIDKAELEHGDLPPVLDVEVMDGVDSDILQKNVAIWLDIVENHFKVKPIIYTNQKFFNRHLADEFRNYPIWIARYNKFFEPMLRSGHGWQFWQYGNRGSLSGIHGNVDLNVFYGSSADLADLCLIRPEPLLKTPPAPPVEEDAIAVAP